MYVLTENDSGRLQYVLSFIFEEVCSMPYKIIRFGDPLPSAAGIHLVYGEERKEWSGITPKVSIPKSNLLFEQGIQPLDPDVTIDRDYSLPFFFGSEAIGNYDLRFDIFAMIFYCLSRYEEYKTPAKDRYGRFPATASLAGKHGFLDKPLIDWWLGIFIRKLEEKSGQTIPRKQKFAVFPTIDIDRVWAYAHKEKNHLPGMLKDMLTGHFSRVTDRLRVLKNAAVDPFFTFDHLHKHLSRSKEKPLFFILFAKNPDAADINHARDLDAFRIWLASFSKTNEIGLHPSFRSHQSPAILEDEKKALEDEIHKPVTASRQHYILFRLPETYRSLAEIGIEDDYSMGYPEIIGYRASTGYSYRWYDIEKETATGLRIHPFQFMDVTLRKYMRLNPDDAITLLSSALESAAKTGSPVRFIWHNSSFYPGNGWKGWDEVFNYLAEQATR